VGITSARVTQTPTRNARRRTAVCRCACVGIGGCLSARRDTGATAGVPPQRPPPMIATEAQGAKFAWRRMQCVHATWTCIALVIRSN
jgi:hypothetical protein